MEHLSIEVLAAVVAAELASQFASTHAAIERDDALRDAIAARVETAMRRLARQERDACAALCLQRQAMWEATEARSTIAEPLRHEARSRANEAQVIADAIREGVPSAQPGPGRAGA
jgi:hypothetical protein